MIRGHKPAAYFEKGIDADGRTVQGEQRSCVHCQYFWEYQPGSGTRRGYCLRCDGWLCGRDVCALLQRRMLAKFARLSGASDRHCIPYTDFVERLREEFVHHPLYQVTPSGLVVPR